MQHINHRHAITHTYNTQNTNHATHQTQTCNNQSLTDTACNKTVTIHAPPKTCKHAKQHATTQKQAMQQHKTTHANT